MQLSVKWVLDWRSNYVRKWVWRLISNKGVISGRDISLYCAFKKIKTENHCCTNPAFKHILFAVRINIYNSIFAFLYSCFFLSQYTVEQRRGFSYHMFSVQSACLPPWEIATVLFLPVSSAPASSSILVVLLIHQRRAVWSRDSWQWQPRPTPTEPGNQLTGCQVPLTIRRELPLYDSFSFYNNHQQS